MVHNNTKYWSMTWDTNIRQKKIPNEEALLSFFDRVADEYVFQYEKGTQKKKEHITKMILKVLRATITSWVDKKSKTLPCLDHIKNKDF